jgi:hypothetical protein
MTATIQIKRRVGSSGVPATLAVGELAFQDPGGGPASLYVGTSPTAVLTLVSNARQVEIAGAQTVTGAKTFSPGSGGSFHLTGGASTNILTTDGAGNVSWSAAPGGGISAVSHDTTLTGDGNATPLSVIKIATARTIGIGATGGTTITQTPASFDGSANVTISGFEVTGLDGGTY